MDAKDVLYSDWKSENRLKQQIVQVEHKMRTELERLRTDFDERLERINSGARLPWSQMPTDVGRQYEINALRTTTSKSISELRRDNEQLHAENDQLRTVLDFLVHVVCSNKTGNELQALIDVVRNGSIIDASDLHKWITGEYFNVSITWGEEK